MRGALFGGSFDPIHLGHLALIRGLAEGGRFEKIFICPAGISPHKLAAPPVATGPQRVEMARLACEGLPLCEVLSDEVEREGPSYTIDTVRALLKRLPAGSSLRLVLSVTLTGSLPSWREAEELVRLAPPLLVQHGEAAPDLSSLFYKDKNFELVRLETPAISSTMVRQMLKEKRSCLHLLPANVVDYIQHQSLY